MARTPLTDLYLDMNSFYASVEQHEDPALRGRPVGITAVEAETGCVVAASYEAKAFGVQTGDRVFEARRKCPDIIFRPSRHRLYFRYNQRIAQVLDQYAEVVRIRSIDEFQIGLSGPVTELEDALPFTRYLKRRVAEEVSPYIRFSAGLGPNELLAKIAGKLEKPDGLRWLAPEVLPGWIAHLALDDLPGISRGVRTRLYRAQVYDPESLYHLPPKQARLIWGSVDGERFVRALRGEKLPKFPTERHGYGQSKVLAPDFRQADQARLVGRWLVEKAVHRLRRDGYCAQRFSLFVRHYPRGGWKGSLRTGAQQDTGYFCHAFEMLWQQMRAHTRSSVLASLGVHLSDLLPLAHRSGDLFATCEPAAPTKQESLSRVIDQINGRYGSGTVTFGIDQAHPGFFESG